MKELSLRILYSNLYNLVREIRYRQLLSCRTLVYTKSSHFSSGEDVPPTKSARFVKRNAVRERPHLCVKLAPIEAEWGALEVEWGSRITEFPVAGIFKADVSGCINNSRLFRA